MSHWIVLPVVLPAMTAAFLTLVLRHQLWLTRIFSLAATGLFAVLALFLAIEAATGEIGVYSLGDWPIPFGIVLVADRLSTMMVSLLGVLALFVLFYVVGTGWDRRGRHFHALFQFQIMGLAGAFLTGDVFNLFVFFEVLLIASYGLIIHSGGGTRFRVGVQYVVYNLLGSTLFLFALGTIYASAGSLNMADLAVRVADLPADRTMLIRIGAVLLLMVFAVKAAILPLHFWLPASYAAAPGPVGALFAIMTKVGAYAIIRVYTLIFPPTVPSMANLFDVWLMPAALATLAVGMIGILAARSLERLTAFAVLGSMGNLLVAVALFTEQAAGVALYYVVHSVLATALLFLVADLVVGQRRTGGVLTAAQPPILLNGLIACGFFAGGIALIGLPPFSGFIGKLLILDAARDRPDQWVIWAVVLSASFLATVGFARAGSTLFWRAASVEEPNDGRRMTRPGPMALWSAAMPVALLALLTALAGPALTYTRATAAQLYDTGLYINAVTGHEVGRPLYVEGYGEEEEESGEAASGDHGDGDAEGESH